MSKLSKVSKIKGVEFANKNSVCETEILPGEIQDDDEGIKEDPEGEHEGTE